MNSAWPAHSLGTRAEITATSPLPTAALAAASLSLVSGTQTRCTWNEGCYHLPNVEESE